MLRAVRRLMIVLMLLVSLVAQAQNCERFKDGASKSVSALSDEARLAFLSRLLGDESVRARNYTLFWGATYSMLGLIQLGLMPLFKREEQPDWYLGAAGTAVGLGFTLLGVPAVMEEGPRYAQKASVATVADTCSLLAEGEKMLEVGAETEAASFKWYLHAGNVLFNIGLGLVLGLGYGRWTPAIVNTIVGTIIGEANILTAPSHLISGLRRYRSGESPPAVTFKVIPTAGPGLGLLVQF